MLSIIDAPVLQVCICLYMKLNFMQMESSNWDKDKQHTEPSNCALVQTCYKYNRKRKMLIEKC